MWYYIIHMTSYVLKKQIGGKEIETAVFCYISSKPQLSTADAVQHPLRCRFPNGNPYSA